MVALRGPVLLACLQWDPLGLARRLPSLGVRAWRSAPLLPWRVQCPVRVCAALAAGSGGSGRNLVLCLSRFPHPAPRVPRCVSRAVPSRCPLPSLARTPFHAVCVSPVLGPVALLVVPACPLRVCALALPRCPLRPPLGGVACAPRAVPALGAGRALPRGPCPSVCPAPVPCSVLRAPGGAVRSRFPPTWQLLRGASEVRRSPSPDCLPTGRAVGVRYPRAVGAGVWVWGPNTVPLACMPCGGCVPRGWCGGGASQGGGGVVRGVWCQALSLPRPPVLWAGCRGPLPTGCGCPRGAPVAWGWGVRGRALSHPRLPALWADCRGALPTGCWCGGVRAWGPVTDPTARALASWLWAVRAARGRLRGAPPAWVWGVRGRALSHPQLPALWAGCRGSLPTGCGCRGGAGVGTRHQPHSARSCELALLAVGAA